MKKTLVLAAAAVAMGGLTGIAAAQVKPDVLVKQRQILGPDRRHGIGESVPL